MTKLTLRKIVVGLFLMTAALTVGCTEPQARTERLTGQDTHERHSTGIESQANDM